jgi:hypothetical protein
LSPLAQRCALIEVESIDKTTLFSPQSAKASKIACQRPHLAKAIVDGRVRTIFGRSNC